MKLKRRKRKSLIVYLIILIIIFLFFYFKNIKIEKSNSSFINKLLYLTDFTQEKENKNIINEFIELINGIDLSKPVSIVNKNFETKKDMQTFSYIENKKRVYIYSTHPTEGFIDTTDTIVDMSYILQEKLNNLGIETVVEKKSAKEYIETYNLNYEESYKATRVFLKDAMKLNNYDLIIDLHRDATKQSITTFKKDDETYARPMFVQHVGYPKNVSLAKKLNSIIEKKYPGLSRGIYNKYNDNFNQDLSERMILLELGGNYNSRQEAINTLDIIAISIKELLNES